MVETGSSDGETSMEASLARSLVAHSYRVAAIAAAQQADMLNVQAEAFRTTADAVESGEIEVEDAAARMEAVRVAGAAERPGDGRPEPGEERRAVLKAVERRRNEIANCTTELVAGDLGWDPAVVVNVLWGLEGDGLVTYDASSKEWEITARGQEELSRG